MKKLFDEIPYIENDRLILKKIEKEDADALAEMINSSRVYRYLPSFLFELQYEDVREAIENIYLECFTEKESLILGIYLKENMAFCGLAEFYGFKDRIHKTCIGYRLSEKYWDLGIATETVGLMLDYLFSETDIEIVTASTMVENRASARVLEKNGFIMTASGVPEDWGFDEPTSADKWFR